MMGGETLERKEDHFGFEAQVDSTCLHSLVLFQYYLVSEVSLSGLCLLSLSWNTQFHTQSPDPGVCLRTVGGQSCTGRGTLLGSQLRRPNSSVSKGCFLPCTACLSVLWGANSHWSLFQNHTTADFLKRIIVKKYNFLLWSRCLKSEILLT